MTNSFLILAMFRFEVSLASKSHSKKSPVCLQTKTTLFIVQVGCPIIQKTKQQQQKCKMSGMSVPKHYFFFFGEELFVLQGPINHRPKKMQKTHQCINSAQSKDSRDVFCVKYLG